MKKFNWINSTTDDLFTAILSLKKIDEAQRFFRDLLTETEILEFSNRWKVAQMLSKNISYSKIEKRTNMSTTTIARISKWLNNGMNGYKLIIKRVNPVTLSSNSGKSGYAVNHHHLASAG